MDRGQTDWSSRVYKLYPVFGVKHNVRFGETLVGGIGSSWFHAVIRRHVTKQTQMDFTYFKAIYIWCYYRRGLCTRHRGFDLNKRCWMVLWREGRENVVGSKRSFVDWRLETVRLEGGWQRLN